MYFQSKFSDRRGNHSLNSGSKLGARGHTSDNSRILKREQITFDEDQYLEFELYLFDLVKLNKKLGYTTDPFTQRKE